MLSKNKFWILFVLIFVPLILSYLFFQGEPQYKQLDILGPVTVNENGDTSYHTIPEFRLTDQMNNSFSSHDLEGKIHVANFIFTRCPKECPVMTSNMKKVHDRFRDMEDLKFISFSIDPNHDTAEVLREFAEQYDADHNRWRFLTGDKDEIYDLAGNGYFVAVREGTEDTQSRFIHSELFILIDQEMRIRGIYDGMNEREIMHLQDEILVLQNEYR